MRRRFQFSLKWIFALPVFAGAVLTAMTARPLWVSILCVRMLLIAWVGLLGVMVAQGGRFARAFGIAAFFPAAVGAVLAVRPIFYSRVQMPPSDVANQALRMFNDMLHLDFKFSAGFLLAASLGSGIAGQAMAWLRSNSLERQ